MRDGGARQGRRRADYGRGRTQMGERGAMLLDDDHIVREMEEYFDAPDYKPPVLPAIALEALELTSRPDVGLHRFQHLLERDQMLAGKVLRLARSPAYTPNPSAVRSLKQAVGRLGVAGIRDVVMEAALGSRVFRADRYATAMEHLALHCSATAHLCRLIGRRTPLDSEYAFLCGLLHDVGIAGILLAMGDRARRGAAEDCWLVWPAIDTVHERASARMVERWGLPPDIALVVRNHHDVVIDGYAHPLGAVVCLAEHLATTHGAAAMGPTGKTPSGHVVDRTPPRRLDIAREALGLSPEALAALGEEAEGLIASLS